MSHISPPPDQQNCIKTFQFKISTTADKETDSLSIHIRELFSTEYSNFVWPSALVLSDFICSNWKLFQAKTVLEIGSGTGVCAIVCAKIGCKTYLTDKFDSEKSLQLCRENIKLNNVMIDMLPLKWGNLYETLPQANYIIGSDCFYDEGDFENILFTVSILLDNSLDSKNSAFYTAYQIRSSSYSIECLIKKWNLKCRMIPFSSSIPLNSNQAVEIYEITKCDI